MCAICGIFDLAPRPNAAAALRSASAAGRHRGPDGDGLILLPLRELVSARAGRGAGASTITDGEWNVGLAHRRLSILDLSDAGHQPMSSADGRYWMVYNGEVYNYVELREELQRLGHQFQSRSDTEVVLAAYEAWGVGCLCRFNGMWAFAIYDRERHSLFCARDRFGVKPFLYHVTPGRFAFASELKQMRELCPTAWKVEPGLLGDFLLWKLYAHTPETFVQGIHELPPSHYLEVTEDALHSGKAVPVQYWTPTARANLSESAAVAEFRSLIEESTRLRLRSDVPVAVTLSGGLDSSSLTCLAAAAGRVAGSARLQAFTAVYDDHGYSERGFAKMAATKAGADHVLIHPDSADLDRDWDYFVRTMESPFLSLSHYSNWKVYGAIRGAGVKVVLCGQGGDELLLGYERYRVPLIALQLRRGEWANAVRGFCRTPGHAGLSLWNWLPYFTYFSSPRVRGWRRERQAGCFLRHDFRAASSRRREHLVNSLVHRDRNELQIKEYYRYQLQHLLQHEDRVSMCHGVETRLPFLDYRLLDLVMGLSDDFLVRDGWSKWLLRKSLADVLPEPIRCRKDKMGFDTPTGRLIGDNRPFFTSLLQRHQGDPLIDVPAVLAAYKRGGVEESFLCSVCSYLTWKEQFDIRS